MGHLNIVLLLLQSGASPDVRNIVSDDLRTFQTSRKHFTNSIQLTVFTVTTVVSALISVARQHFTWLHEQVRWKWFAVC